MAEGNLENTAVIAQLNKIIELELAGVIRYTHYSFMVHGFGHIPIVSWLRSQADESMLEEYATRMISDETRHAGDVRKMPRTPRRLIHPPCPALCKAWQAFGMAYNRRVTNT